MIRQTTDPPPLDRTDSAIVRALRENARLSNKELAAVVGLAPSTCHERVRRLVRRGVFLGFHADVQPKAIGAGLQALVAVRLERHTRASYDAFRRHVLALPEVLALFHVAGANDFLVHVATRDSDALRDLILGAFTAYPEVRHVETSLIYEHTRNPNFAASP